MLNPIPFYTQTAVLDKYIHSSNPGEEPEILEVLLEAIKTKPELREYFFRNGPHPAWAKILWENGFFQTPPPPIKAKEGSFLPHWDVQVYLEKVADQVPEIVLKHVLEFQGHGWYISRALNALLNTPADTVKQAIPKILDWLQDPMISHQIEDVSVELMFKMADNERKESTFALFTTLTKPVQKEVPKSLNYAFWSGAAVKIVAEHLLKKNYQSRLQKIAELDLLKYIETLEENLRILLIMESQIYNQPRTINTSWWRSAIEETDQDLLDRDRDILLNSLRTGLESQLKKDASLVKTFIQRYSNDPNRLFYRLCIYLLSLQPNDFLEFIAPILQTPENFSDDEIHHEFFILLSNAFRLLTKEQQKTILDIIWDGPPREELDLIGQRDKNESEEDIKEITDKYVKYWRRDRLWMIKKDLQTNYEDALNQIVVEVGEPEHITFRTWTSGGYWVKQVAPLNDQELADIEPFELVHFLENWAPDPNQRFGPTQISYEGLARSLGKLVARSLDSYSNYLYDLAAKRAEYATAILSQFSEPDYVIEDWHMVLNLCERLLANKELRESTISDKGDWTQMRKAVVKLLEQGLRKEPSLEHLDRFRDLLLILINDPSPTINEDRPPEGWFGHSDPMTVAINYTRPMAVNTLITYAHVRANHFMGDQKDFSDANRLEQDVQQALSNKLIQSREPSLAVRSVFGNRTANLYWLNKDWWLSNLDEIFPDVADNKSLLLFAAAWDSFVINHFYTHLVKYLRPKYIQAISFVAKGQTTRPSFYSPTSFLASHLIWEYFLGGTILKKPVGLEDSLLKKFFEEVAPESRGLAVAACSQIIRNQLSQNEKYWPKVRALWEWRAQEASATGYSIDFQDEMIHFAEMLQLVPETESISSLWNLLETLIPYVAQSEYRDLGWYSIEKFLLARFEHEPLRSIQYYNLLWSQKKSPPLWFRHSEEAIKLVTRAVENPRSREEALRLIDFLARRSDYTFKDLYEKFTMK